MTVSYRARCREKRLRYQRAVNRRIELHGKSFTISPAVSRPVLKVKDAKTKPEVCQSGSRGSRHVFCRIPTPPRMAEFPVTQDGTCGVLDPRHNTSSIGFLPVSVFAKNFFRITIKRLHMVACFIFFSKRKDRVYYDPGSLGESASFNSVRKNDIKI